MASEEASSEDRLAAELKEARPDPEYVRSLLRDNGGGVPTLQRREVWALLLGVRKRDVFSLDDKIKTAAEDLENQRVILADAKRTRAHTEEFRSEEMQTLLVKLLTFYCKSNSLRYKQGLNEVLAPFIRVFRRPDSTVDDDAPAVFNALSAFIARFMPHMYNDEAFTALQAQNALFGMLLRYFDPELSAHLDSCGIIPELYASGWFMTLFAHSFPMDQLLAVWDAYIVANDPQLHTWCALLVLTGHRDRLLASDAANLPITLSDVKREERETQSVDVASLCARAIELKAGTPRSFLRDLRKACFAEAPANPALIEKLQRMHCIRVEPQELAHDLFASRIASSRSVSVSSTAAPSAKVALNFFVVDARHLDAFDQSHLMLAYHFPNGDSEEERVIDAIRSSIASGGDGSAALAGGTSDLVAEVLASLDALAAMRGRHLCIIPPSYADAAEGEGLSALLPTSLGAAAASTMSLLVSATMGTAEEAAIASPSSSLGTTTSEEARAMLCCTARLMFAKRLKHVSILGSGSFDGSFDEVKRLIELRAGGSDDLLVAPMPAEEREAMRAAAAASAAERDGVSSREGRRWGLGGLGSLFAARAPAGPAEETPPSSELGLADFGLEDNDAAALKATPTEAESGGRRGGGGGGWFSRFRVGGKGSDAMEEDSSDAGTPPLEKEKKGGIFSRIRSRSTSTGTEGDSDTTPQEGKGRWRPNLRKLRKSISSSAQLEAGVTVGLRRLRAMDPSSSIFRCRRVLQTTRVRATEGAATRGEGDEMPKASRKARLYPGRFVLTIGEQLVCVRRQGSPQWPVADVAPRPEASAPPPASAPEEPATEQLPSTEVAPELAPEAAPASEPEPTPVPEAAAASAPPPGEDSSNSSDDEAGEDWVTITLPQVGGGRAKSNSKSKEGKRRVSRFSLLKKHVGTAAKQVGTAAKQVGKAASNFAETVLDEGDFDPGVVEIELVVSIKDLKKITSKSKHPSLALFYFLIDGSRDVQSFYFESSEAKKLFVTEVSEKFRSFNRAKKEEAAASKLAAEGGQEDDL